MQHNQEEWSYKALKDFYDINNELKNYSEKLTKKKQIIVATKLDVAQDESLYNELEKH